MLSWERTNNKKTKKLQKNTKKFLKAVDRKKDVMIYSFSPLISTDTVNIADDRKEMKTVADFAAVKKKFENVLKNFETPLDTKK
ncbi:MAG: hypothetical protein KBT02_04365 [Treponema sp.]|nr:hypothetical protein [Candidatus Treponema caballi]